MKNSLLINLIQISLNAVVILTAPIPRFSSQVLATVIEEDTNNWLDRSSISKFPTSILISSEESQESKKIQLTLEEAVNLALENNRDLKNAYLRRAIEREDLAQQEALFVPNLTPTLKLFFDRNRRLSGLSRTDLAELNLDTTVDFLVPSGATFDVGWTSLGQTLDNIERFGAFSGEDFSRQTFRASFTQPFLRGFGPTITKAPIEIARRNEDINILSLKRQLIDIITQTIQGYRNLVRAQEELKIQKQSLERARAQLEVTQALIDAGRRARIDLIQNQTQIANQEVAVESAENGVLDAQSQLIQILDIDPNSELIPTEIPEGSLIPSEDNFAIEELLKLAFANDPDYLTNLLNIDIAELRLLLAKDNSRWDLSLNLDYNNSLDTIENNADNSQFTVSLDLTREFPGDRNLQRDIIRRQVELERSRITLEETKQTLEIEVKNRIREVNFNLRQVYLARRARELSQQQLDIEREKQRLGVGSLFELINFENSLVSAQNQELNAVINYLNALTNLQSTIGVTLDVWKIKIDELSIE